MHAAPAISETNGEAFLLSMDDVQMLQRSEGFSVLREHLAEHYAYYGLCGPHRTGDLAGWLLVRDTLHALLVPIVELFEKACSVASEATRAQRHEDLEYAFTGPARDSFVFLQCFLSSEKERDWCYTRGCPTCIVAQSLDSPCSIRLLYAAISLSDVHYPFTLEGPCLPSFMWFLDYVRKAVAQDPLYGEDFFELLQPRAERVASGIEDLIRQCLELSMALASASSTPSDAARPETSAPAPPVLAPRGGASKGMSVRRSEMAQLQMKLKIEEDCWREEMLQKCTQRLAALLERQAETPTTVGELAPDG
ncbi:hypothetical protein Tdes44962_MAKER08722 [Teratosphaeria destructans]|uniref:Uncharacterized protein n=1 Tax=Teratosphaeria destructans TaxID=418781 RepID=A0A9W7W420_9PEZI|nr:hypothetical protein Tdes44962_MAKER08722 [Teratosphaeria destructans]